MELTAWTAFVAGVITFFTPCVLPLIPVYIGFVTGFSIEELKHRRDLKTQLNVAVKLLAFILGFTVVFVSLGAAASSIGYFLIRYKLVLIRVAGGLILLFGLYLLGVFNLPFLNSTRRLNIGTSKKSSIISAFLFGIAFGFGWSPCTGPILGSIVLLASTSSTVTTGVYYLLLFSAGLAVPLFFSGIAFSYFMQILSRFKNAMGVVDKLAGVLLVLFGLLLLLGRASFIYSLFEF